MNEKVFYVLLGRSMYHIDSIYAEFAKKSSVTPTLLWILYAINDNKVHTQREICYDWSLPKSTVNTLIMELKNKDYVKLEPIKGKRREMNIIITESGKKYANNVLKDIYQKEAEVFKKLDFNVDDFVKKLQKLELLLGKGDM